jgi:Tfp pilus assembly protein PilV
MRQGLSFPAIAAVLLLGVSVLGSASVDAQTTQAERDASLLKHNTERTTFCLQNMVYII